MRSCKTVIVLGLLAMLMLSGAQCTFIASSGDNDSDRDDEDKTAPGLRLILGVGGALETPV